jgi:hypothetical protein
VRAERLISCWRNVRAMGFYPEQKSMSADAPEELAVDVDALRLIRRVSGAVRRDP